MTGSLALVSSASASPTVVPLSATAVSPTTNPPPSDPPTAPVSSVTVSPTNASVAINTTVSFAAAVQGTTTNTSVTWSASTGTISAAGVYTAPAKTGAAIITATSVADPTKSASATVSITSAAPAVSSVSLTPLTGSVTTSGTLQLTATVQGTASNKSVTWKTSSGTISASGLFTAASTAGTATVTATSAADTTKSATATITVTASAQPVVDSISISPAAPSILTGATQQFTATVQGTATNKSVSWSATSGTITASGLLTAPASAGKITVTATSLADTTKSASTTVSVATPVANGVSVSPTAGTILTGATLQLSATVQGTVTNKSVTWSASVGTVTANGLFTAPATAGTATIKATSVADPTKSASATITVNAPSVTSIAVSPTTVTVLAGGTQQFNATVQGTVTNKSIAWSASSGTISSAGVFTAAATPGAATITVTSLADPTKTATATVNVTAPSVSSIAISPTTASIQTGANQQFSAAVQGTVTNKAVTWSTSGGSITSAGLLTAPASGGKVTVTATSVADSTKTASASVTVTAPTVTSISVTPATANILTLATQQFTATVQGTVADKSVTWSASSGAVSSAGLFTAGGTAGTVTVTATSNADKTKSASATVTLALPSITSIAISPASTSVQTGGKLTFSATVKGTATDTSVTWSAAKGTINSSGAYVAPSSATTDSVTATSNADSTKTATATVTVTAATLPPSGPVAAFPGAQGGGAASLGGRGGVVMEVTNLNDSGSGSLRACVQASGPRTCVFRVGGIIHPQSTIRANSGSLTIAGQTAPGGGIVIQGDKMPEGAIFFFAGSDTIIRYITCSVGNGPGHSPGPDSGVGCVELASGNNQHNVVVDHISFRWWDNKSYVLLSNAGFSPITKTVVQWSLFYEPNAGHPVGLMTDDSGGFAGSDTDDDFHHNLFVNIGHRLPLYNTRSGRWINNIVYNWQFYGLLTQGGVKMDIINNKYVPANLNSGNTNHEFDFNNGQSSDDPDGSNPGPPSIYVSGNIGPHQSNPNGDQTVMTAQGNEGGDSGGSVPSSWFRSSPMSSEAYPIEADDESDLDSVMLGTVGNSRGVDCTGNWFNRRDSNDSRIVSQYQNGGNGTFFTNASQPSVSSGSACTESLHDGIPDQWKSANGLSTTDPNLYKATAPNGYTYLENYMNGVSPQ
jgi:Bacterial Ig-like domain (group 2)